MFRAAGVSRWNAYVASQRLAIDEPLGVFKLAAIPVENGCHKFDRAEWCEDTF
jgi:hypothetical protein